ncbi:MAG: hypothetical protein RLZ10_1309 [Bacteroidota bacterium]
MYELISNLRPYFFSLREIERNVSLDLKIPTTWRLEHVQQVVSQYKSMSLKVQDKNDKYQLVSLVSFATQEGYDTARSCAVEIIKYNIELEEKDRLFKEKVRELETLFRNESLDKLKDINFLENNEQEDSTGIGLAVEGDGEGQDGDPEPQKKSSKRD